MSDSIQVQANGEAFQLSPGVSLPTFLEQQGLDVSCVVVERNGLALTPGEARRTLLQDGDRLEVVRIVAGG